MGSFGPLLSSGRCLESLSRKFGLQEEALYADMRLWAPRVGGLSPQNKGALPQHGGTEPHLRVHSSPVPLFCFSFQGTEPHLRPCPFQPQTRVSGLKASFQSPRPRARAEPNLGGSELDLEGSEASEHHQPTAGRELGKQKAPRPRAKPRCVPSAAVGDTLTKVTQSSCNVFLTASHKSRG